MPWTVPEAFAGWVAAQLVAVVWAGMLTAFRSDSSGLADSSSIWWFLAGGVGLWAGYVAVGAYLAGRGSGGGADQILGSSWSPLAAIVGLAAGVACQLVVVPVVYRLTGDLIPGDPEEAARDLVDMVSGPAATVALVIAVVIVAPVAEELMYRRVLMRPLADKVGVTVAVVLSSAIFALAHGQLILVPGLMTFAVVLGFLAFRFDGLSAPIAAHMSFNATTVVMLLS